MKVVYLCLLIFLMATANAVTIDEIGGYTSAAIQESGVSGDTDIKIDNLMDTALLLILYNTSDPDPSLSEIGRDAYRLGLAVEKVMKQYPEIKIRPSTRINPHFNLSQASTKAWLDMSLPVS